MLESKDIDEINTRHRESRIESKETPKQLNQQETIPDRDKIATYMDMFNKIFKKIINHQNS